jgi:hypothetical protein
MLHVNSVHPLPIVASTNHFSNQVHWPKKKKESNILEVCRMVPIPLEETVQSF